MKAIEIRVVSRTLFNAQINTIFVLGVSSRTRDRKQRCCQQGYHHLRTRYGYESG
jgi:hypothetical protein